MFSRSPWASSFATIYTGKNMITLALLTFTGQGLVPLLIALLVLAIVIYVVILIVNLIPLPPPVKQIVFLILGIIFLIALLKQFGLI